MIYDKMWKKIVLKELMLDELGIHMENEMNPHPYITSYLNSK